MSDGNTSVPPGSRDDTAPTIPLDRNSPAATPHAQSAPRLDLEEAQHLVGDRYRIESIAGQGGMGRVFTAHDQRLDRRVAIKFLTGPLGETAREQLLSEARAMAGLRHPGIAPVHEVVCDVKSPFLVMGWIDGIDMDVAWRDLSLDERVAMVDRVVAAVGELHDAGLVHLDIKPRNILVDRFGTPVLVDFGLTRSVANTPGTSSGGTPGYAAPEQFTSGAMPSPSADVHALGVLLFQAMTDQLPWTGDSTKALLNSMINVPPRMVEDLAPGSPWPLQRITMAALERAPSRRYPDARSLGLDLARYERGELVAARPSQLIRRFEEQVRIRQEETEAWHRQGLVTSREASRLERLYERIQRPESHWIVDSRRLTVSQITLYLGGWIILLAMTVGLAFGWQALENTAWLRWALPGGMMLGTFGTAIMMHRIGQPRLALAYLFMACLLLPIAVAVFLWEMGWFASDNTESQILSVIIGIPPTLSNINLLLSAAALTAASLAARPYLRSNAFAIPAVIGFIVTITAVWSTTGLLTDSRSGWALLGLVLLGTAAAMLAIGVPLNRCQQAIDRLVAPGRCHLFDAWAILSGGALLTVVSLTLLAWNVPAWYLPGLLEGPAPPWEGSDRLAVNDQSRSVAFIINGFILMGLSWWLGRTRTAACGRLAELLRWIIPAHIIGGLLALEADTQSIAAAWVWISAATLASLCFMLASVRKQWRPFVVSGLLGLAWSFVVILHDLEDQLVTSIFEAVVISIIIGVSLLGIGIMVMAGWLSNRADEQG